MMFGPAVDRARSPFHVASQRPRWVDERIRCVVIGVAREDVRCHAGNEVRI